MDSGIYLENFSRLPSLFNNIEKVEWVLFKVVDRLWKIKMRFNFLLKRIFFAKKLFWGEKKVEKKLKLKDYDISLQKISSKEVAETLKRE